MRAVLPVFLFSFNLAAAVPPDALLIGSLASAPSGEIYAAGRTVNNTGFIARLSDNFVYRTDSPVSAISISPSGEIFAAGVSLSASSFPQIGLHPFLIKIDPNGNLQFSRQLDAYVTDVRRIAVNASGESAISGSLFTPMLAGAFLTTPGAVTLNSVSTFGYVIKVDASGQNTAASILGYGGGPVALDSAGNIYVAESLTYANLTPTPGALQTGHATFGCSGTSYVGTPCSYGYVAKISPDGTKLLYATYLTGDYGSSPSALFVDAAGNAIVAGTTSSHNFPTTPGALQTENRGTDGPSVDYGFTGAHVPFIPPPTAGTVSKINPDGTALVWSTYFGGSGIDSITDAQLDANGNVVFTGLTGSPDLPGSATLPRGCKPSYLRQRLYVAKIGADGASVLGARYIESFSTTPTSEAVTADGSLVLAQNDRVSTFAAGNAEPPACVVDAADLLPLDRIAPGQLLTVFSNFGTTNPPVNFNGIPGDILYSGPDQINVRVPEALTGATVMLSVATPEGQVSRQFDNAPAVPSAFVKQAPACLGSSYPVEIVAVALNEDGSPNSCDRPAAPGSLVTFFLNGVGNTPPAVTSTASIVSVKSDPNSPGVIQVQIRIVIPSPFSTTYSTYSVSVNGVPVRDSLFLHVAPVGT